MFVHIESPAVIDGKQYIKILIIVTSSSFLGIGYDGTLLIKVMVMLGQETRYALTSEIYLM